MVTPMSAGVGPLDRSRLDGGDSSSTSTDMASSKENLPGEDEYCDGDLSSQPMTWLLFDGKEYGGRHAELVELVVRALERLKDTVAKSAAIGFTLRGGLHMLSVLVSQLLSPRRRQEKRSKAHLRSLTLDTLKFTVCLAAFGGTYVSVEEGLSMWLGKKRSKSHSGLASYIFLRGLLLLVRVGNKDRSPALMRWLLTASRWEHSDVLLMCLASSQILPSWLLFPDTLPSSYIKFLNVQGGKKFHIYQAIREWARRSNNTPKPFKALSQTRFDNVPMSVPCEFVHPGMSCSRHSAGTLPKNFRRALSVYIPVYVVPALLVHRANLLSKPLEISCKATYGILRSSLFLAVYVSLAWRSACLAHQARLRLPHRWLSSPAMYAIAVWLSGVATLVEKKSRRLELALYCMSRALASFGLFSVKTGWVPPRLLGPRGDIVVFAAGVSAIAHCYSGCDGLHRDVFKSKYLSVLDFVFGNSGIGSGAISHVPSSQDLLQNLLKGAALRPRPAHRLDRLRSFRSQLELETAGEHPLPEGEDGGLLQRRRSMSVDGFVQEDGSSCGPAWEGHDGGEWLHVAESTSP